MKLFTALLLIYTSILFSQNTPLELNNYLKPTSYDQITEYIYQLDKSSDLLSVEVLGKSVEERNLYLMKFSNSEFGKDSTKLKVLIFAQQHGNEQSGKVGALLLSRELLKRENSYLFDKIDFALIPQMNPDGSEKNKRRNGNDVDLNRNHLILSEPETMALHKIFSEYLFEVSMDVHEYAPYGETWRNYGYRFNSDVEVGVTTNINISKEIREFSKSKYLRFIEKHFKENNFSYFEYSPGGPPEIDYIRHSTYDINDGRQSLGIQNTFSFIQEGLNGKDVYIENIKHRAEGQMTGMLGLLKFSYANRDKIKNIIKSERAKLIQHKVDEKVAIQLDHFSDGSKLNLPLYSYYSNSDTIVIVNDYRPVVKSTFDVNRPKGYLIPKSLTEIIDWAEKHSIKYFEYEKTDKEKIEQYFVKQIDSIDFERDIIVNPLVELKMVNDINVGDYVFIPLNQIKNNVIVIALEPKSILGLVTYKKFEHLLKVNEVFPILRVIANN
ncbi:MAG: M14 family zinc carboxypeptidase [Ignavibacteriaceae bacterium]|nr:M14 family zinc carboxypeptidase [Ignavibacteriaceae bacterium]